jgi:hypothetical protein
VAIIPCVECGGQVSTTAEACPHCGAPQALAPAAAPAGGAAGTDGGSGIPRIPFWGWVLLVFLVLGAFSVAEEWWQENLAPGRAAAVPSSPGGSRPAPSTPAARPTAPTRFTPSTSGARPQGSPATPRTGAAQRPSAPRVATQPPSTPPRDLCREYRTQQVVDSMARAIARGMMPGARQIHGRTRGCTSYADAGIARVDLLVEWESTGGRTPYWLSGTLEVGPSRVNWTPGAANDNLRRVQKEWDDTKFWAGVLGLGALAVMAASGSGSRPAAPSRSGRAVICLWNDTPRTLGYDYRWSAAEPWSRREEAAGSGAIFTSVAHDTLTIRYSRVNSGGRFPLTRQVRLAAVRQPSTQPPQDCSGPRGEFQLRLAGDSIAVLRQ